MSWQKAAVANGTRRLPGLSWKKIIVRKKKHGQLTTRFIIFRYAEAYLLRAEALVETGGSTDEAKSLIKVIRDRAGNTNDIDKMVAERYNGSLRDLVRNERRVELAQEGLVLPISVAGTFCWM
mgnify:CR=1 FL=1